MAILRAGCVLARHAAACSCFVFTASKDARWAVTPVATRASECRPLVARGIRDHPWGPPTDGNDCPENSKGEWSTRATPHRRVSLSDMLFWQRQASGGAWLFFCVHCSPSWLTTVVLKRSFSD